MLEARLLDLRLVRKLSEHRLRVAHDAQVRVPVVPYLGSLDVDLDDLGVRREATAVLHHPVQPRAHHQDDVGLPHGSAAGPLEGHHVVLRHQAPGHRRGVEGNLGRVDKPLQLRCSPGEENTAAGKDDRTLCAGEHLHGFADGAGLGCRPAALQGAGGPDRLVLFDPLIYDVCADIDVDRAGAARRGSV